MSPWRRGISIITPNTKAYCAELPLYESVLATSCESGAHFFHVATVGVGLPVISTLKDLVATGGRGDAIGCCITGGMFG